MRASGVFRFFAFTSSLFGRISLKISALRMKASPFAKTRYLPFSQGLRGEGSCLHLDAPFGGLRHDKNDGAKCPRLGGAEGEGSPRNAHPLAFTHNTL